MHHQGDRRTRNTHAQLALAALVALLVLCVPLAADDSFPWLDTLDSGADVKASGAKLIALPMDLHRLDRDDGTVGKIANIAVHGWNSSGYEMDTSAENAGRHGFVNLVLALGLERLSG